MTPRGELGEEAKRYIMAEVTRQVQPMHDLLQSVKEWQLSFWSNGSGRPPGFFQNRMKEDDHWRAEITGKVEDLNTHKATVDLFINELRLSRKFLEEKEMEAKERRRFYLLKVALPIVLGILSIVGIIVKQAVPVVKIIWDNYLHSHPVVSEQLQELSTYQVEAANIQNAKE